LKSDLPLPNGSLNFSFSPFHLSFLLALGYRGATVNASARKWATARSCACRIV
jgi:hypothetical protein